MGTDRKVRLVATESQKYGTRQLRPGDEFEADPADAEDIFALGIGRKDETAVDVKQAPKQPSKPLKLKRKYIKSGKYKRRDMRAED